MAHERDGDRTSLVKRVPAVPAVIAGGAAALLGAPATIQLVEGVHLQLSQAGAEAGMGLLAGVGVVGLVQSGYRAWGGPNRHTVAGVAMVGAGAAGITALAEQMAHVTTDLAASAGLVGVVGAVVAFASAAVVHGPSDGSDQMVRANVLRRTGVGALALGGAGAVALAISAATGMHPPDMALIDGIAAVGLGTAAAPLAGAFVHRRHAQARQNRAQPALGE